MTEQCGTPAYIAPEILLDKGYEGFGVDIWSAGVVLFAIVCGYLPFEDPNTSNRYDKIMRGEYSLPKIGRAHV